MERTTVHGFEHVNTLVRTSIITADDTDDITNLLIGFIMTYVVRLLSPRRINLLRAYVVNVLDIYVRNRKNLSAGTASKSDTKRTNVQFIDERSTPETKIKQQIPSIKTTNKEFSIK